MLSYMYYTKLIRTMTFIWGFNQFSDIANPAQFCFPGNHGVRAQPRKDGRHVVLHHHHGGAAASVLLLASPPHDQGHVQRMFPRGGRRRGTQGRSN